MALPYSTVTLVELTHPDITGKTLRMWGQVVLSPGSYKRGGLPMGLLLFADQRTVDFNGFLRCDVWDEEAVTNLLTYHYSPANDTLQVFQGNVEYLDGVTLNLVDPIISPDQPLETSPIVPQQNLLMFEATFDRTTVRG